MAITRSHHCCCDNKTTFHRDATAGHHVNTLRRLCGQGGELCLLINPLFSVFLVPLITKKDHTDTLLIQLQAQISRRKMAPTLSLLLAATVIASLPFAKAGFDPSSQSNVAVYWGQNSIGQAPGHSGQERLSHYCNNADIDIISIGFMNGLEPPTINFANAGDNCTTFPENTDLLDCPQIESVILAHYTLAQANLLIGRIL